MHHPRQAMSSAVRMGEVTIVGPTRHRSWSGTSSCRTDSPGYDRRRPETITSAGAFSGPHDARSSSAAE
jgi:hypothetical protein